MKIVLAGGTGQVGELLRRALTTSHEVTVLTRNPRGRPGHIPWDARTRGDWCASLEGANAVINLAGRSVNCRYTKANLQEMMDSRVNSARVIGEAIAACKLPPRVWLQMSTATIYAHTFGEPNNEYSGVIGGSEPDVPAYWEYSVRIAKNWEAEQTNAATPHTRKVALRTAMVMSPDRGGVFSILSRLARLGLGGAIGDGRQYMSWIHEHDFVNACLHLIEHSEISGAVNLAAPNPLPQRLFMAILRARLGVKIGLPAAAWMVKLGTWVIGSDAELVLKSRRVVPVRLLETGFHFAYPKWEAACGELAGRVR